ncbi:S8 family serine peptidase [Candidatus Uhrbacteria bacterium]|nr:S8 family serine peptidase [Candidatus Uhrbacteria bacterium]
MRHFFVVILVAFVAFPVSARDVTDRFRSELWYLDQMSAPGAWETETGSQETIVAVLDAGFDLDHEDLVGQYWKNEDEVAGDGTDDDTNGYDDDTIGWDFVDGDSDPSPDLDQGVSDTVASHGTVIAGIIGATANNGLGITGINWDVSIMPLRVLNEFGAGSTTNVRRAIVYAVENGADVLNLSFTFSRDDERLRETIEWAYDQGVVMVAAVGNGNIDTDVTPIYPACFDLEIGKNVVIGVAATDQYDYKADFSNFGTTCTDLTAPGVDIFASVYHNANDLAFITAYASPWEGTSLAAPMVSGAAALLRSAYPSLTPDQVRNVLKLSVDPVAETSLEARLRLGAGRVNLLRALEYATVFAGTGRSTVRNTFQNNPESFVVAQGKGAEPIVRRVNGQGEILVEFLAYSAAFRGGVRLAMGDVDGDGEVEIVTGAGPSGGSQVRIFDLDGNVERQFFALDEGDRNGIFVATGDVNGDGVDEILVTTDQGGTGQVRIFNQYGHLKGAIFPFGRTTSPVRVTVANVDADTQEEIISTLGWDGDGKIIIHDGTGRYVNSFTALGGVTAQSIGHADIDGDGIEEVIVVAGSGHVPKVHVYNQKGVLLKSFFAFPFEFREGVEIVAGDIDRNGSFEIYVTASGAGGPQVRIFNTQTELIGGFFAFDSVHRYGAVAAIY